jgi:predicted GNAT superfamily acetyltransferase
MDALIRSLSSYDEYKACERLQADVFGYDDIEILPYQILQSFAYAGGIVLGAFYADELIGAVMGYTGLTEDGKTYHRSQRLAVLPRYAGRGVGESLKRAQGRLALQYGLHLMCWTYDPLRAVNAHLNIHKLGAVSRQYFERIYTTSSNPRDAGLPVDRLWVEWNLDAPAAVRPQEGRTAEVVLSAKHDKPAQADLTSTAASVIIQIPSSIDAVREQGMDNLLAWRNATREAFTHYFAQGYVVCDFVRDTGYVLAQVDL